MKTEIMISETGEVHGYGSDPWKWVSYLTKEEKAHVRAGGIVLVKGDRLSGPGAQSGTYWRQVKRTCSDRYVHRVPTDAVLKGAGVE